MNSADDSNTWGDECFYCMVCEMPFRSPLHGITRSVERIHFYPDGRLAEAEVLHAESIADYCSPACRDQDRQRLLAEERIKATNPGPGPIEVCARCGGPVDMSLPHLGWTNELMVATWGKTLETMQPVEAAMLAVTCQRCGPIKWAADVEETTFENHATVTDITEGT